MLAALVELIGAIVLLFILPPQIKINFSWILTSGETFGSRWNILALPVFLALVAWIYERILKNNLMVLSKIFLGLNIFTFLLTIFWLVQLPFIQ
jgi:hypothetical protein